jgi:uncharacterized protein (TIRG00374 family)
MLLGAFLLQTIRWKWILDSQNIDLSYGKSLQVSWMAHFFGLYLPGSASGEFIRGYFIWRQIPKQKTAGISTLFMDRILGLFAFLILATLALLFFPMQIDRWYAIFLRFGYFIILITAAISLVLGGFLMVPPKSKWGRCITRYLNASWADVWFHYHKNGYVLLQALLLSLLSSLLVIGAFCFAGRIVGDNVSWNVGLMVVPMVVVANSLPVSPGGIGIAEAAASVLFGFFGIASGATIMIVIRVCNIFVRLPGVMVYLFNDIRIKP